MDWRLITVYTQGQRRVNTEFKPKHKVYFFKTKKSLMSSFGCFHQPEKKGEGISVGHLRCQHCVVSLGVLPFYRV